jgi:hypothetical protein
MSRKDAVVLASRALALLLVLWALTDVSYLPEYVHSLIHHSNQESVLTPHGYWFYYYLVRLASLLVRIVGYSIAARWLFKGGPRVEELFLPSAPEQSATQN